MKKIKTSILDEIENFLEYLSKVNERHRDEESLKNKFGEEKYKSIYNLIGGKYTHGLPKKEEDVKKIILFISDKGLKFLEERQEKRKQESFNRVISSLTSILAITGMISLIKNMEIIELKYLLIA